MSLAGRIRRALGTALSGVRRLTRRLPGLAARPGGDGPEISLRELHGILQNEPGVFGIELRLGKFRRSFGRHWPEHWPEVDRLVRQTVVERAGQRARYAFAGEAYVFLFRDMDRSEARGTVAAISDALRRHAADFERASIAPGGVEHAASASEIEVHPDQDETEARPGPAPFPAAARSSPVVALRPAVMPPAARQAGDRSAAAAGDLAMAIISEGATAGEAAGPNGPRARRTFSRSQRRLVYGLESAIISATARQDWEVWKHAQDRAFPPPGLTFVYRPMWNPRTGTLSTYRIYPALARSPIEFDLGDKVLPHGGRREDESHLDHLVLGRVAYDLIISSMPPPRPFVCVPLHISTLSSAETRSGYLDVCAQIPDALRKFVLFEIQDANRLVGPGQLLAWRRDLSEFCSAVMGQVPVETREFTVWREVGLRAVGCDMRDCQLPEAEIIVRFNDFVTRAGEQQLKTFVRGLKTMSLTIGALGAGFDFVEGDAVQSRLPNEAAGIEKFALEKLYSAA